MTMLVIGESLIDVFYDPDGQLTARHPGGSPLNVAVGLSRLGRKVSLLTRIGNDPDGKLILDYCKSENVFLVQGSITETATSLAHAHLNENHSANYNFEIYSDYPLPPTDEKERATLLANAPQVIHFGSLGAHLAPGNKALRKWLNFYRDTSTISYDPNVRPDLIGSKKMMIEQINEFVPFIDIFKASSEDLNALYGDENPTDIAQIFLNAGVKLFAVTYGSEGLALFTKNNQVHIPAIPVKVVDTVGAGDSLMSALIDGLARISALDVNDKNMLANISRSTLVSLGSFAVTAASITVCRQGANPPNKKEIAAQSDLYSVGAL